MVFFTGIIVWGWIHQKNKIGVQLIANFLKCSVTFLQSSTPVGVINNMAANFVIVADKFFPRDKITKPYVLYGPHINSPVCSGNMGEFASSSADQIFNCLSQWNVNVQKMFSPLCKLVAVPFPVDVEKFAPGPVARSDRKKSFLYVKMRHSDQINSVKSIFKADFTFVYGSYSEDNYLAALKECKFGVWVGCHESQGFALQEALSCDVPLILIDVNSMSEQSGIHIHRSDEGCGVTSAPYWDERCGIKIRSSGQLKESLRIIDLWDKSPRDFVMENLAPEICLKRFQTLF